MVSLRPFMGSDLTVSPEAPGRARSLREAALFPATPDSLRQAFRISSAEYRNRETLFELVHVESRGDARAKPVFEVETQVEPDGWDRLSVHVSHAGDFVRVCASFPAKEVAPGDVLHLQWVVRARSLDGGPSPRVDELLLACNGSRAGKLVCAKLGGRKELGEWTRAEALLQVVKAAPGGEFHLTFVTPSNAAVELAGVKAVVGGRAPAPEPTIAEPAIPEAALLRPVERTVLGAGEPLFAPSAGLGCVDVLRPDAVSGWAVLPGEPAVRTSVSVWVDGRLQAEAVAPSIAEDPARAGAFSLDRLFTPEQADGVARHVEVRFGADGEPLRGGVATLALSHRLEGLVQLEADAAVGWAVDRLALSAPAPVEIIVDGAPVATVEADAPHPVLTGAAHRGGRCAFRFPLPEDLGRERPQVLEARLAGTDLSLPGGALTVWRGGPRHRWSVEAVGADAVRGWIVDVLRPHEPPPLRIEIEGRVPRAPELRPADGGFAFDLRLPRGVAAFSLTLADTGDVLETFDIGPTAAGGERAVPSDAWEPDPALFDAAWYLAAHPEAAAAVAAGTATEAWTHWRSSGAAAGLSPAPWFDERWYRKANPDVDAAVRGGDVSSGFSHWLTTGAREGRRPSPGVDPAWLAQGGADPVGAVLDWWRGGAREPGSAELAAATPRSRPSVAGATRPDLRAAAAARTRPTPSVFDGLVGRMLQDLDAADRKRANAVREALVAGEAELQAQLWANPVAGEPLVSVIMPTFNRAFIIAEAIQSVVEQSWPHWELIVCDDGSTDRTATVVQQFADARVRYLRLEKANGAAARNVGLRFARGDHLAFLDSDNVWRPDYLALCLGLMQNQPGVEMLYTGFIDTQITGARFTEATAAFAAFDYQALLRRNFIDLNTLFLRRSVYEDLGGFDEALPRVQDWDLILKYAQLFEPLAVRTFPAFYRRNAAWGQVTDLYAHLNFNQIVRDRALDRLESGQPAAGRPLARRLALSVVAGPDAGDVADALALARLAEPLADVRLLLPDTEVARRLAGRDASGAERVWRAPTAGVEAITPWLWGEAVLVCDAKGVLDDGGLSEAPVVRLDRDGDLARLRIGGSPADGTLIGALTEQDPDGWPEPAETFDRGLIAVVADESDEPVWHAAARAHAIEGEAVLLAVVRGADAPELCTLFDGGSVAPVDEAAALGLLRWRAEALVIASGGGVFEAGALTAALAGGAAVFGHGPRLALMRAEKSAFAVGSGGPAAALVVASKARIDRDAAAKLRARGLTRYRRLHRTDAVRERLKRALARLVEGAS